MKFLFIADPLAGFKVHKDSTYAMMREAARRGHGLFAMLAEDLAWRDGRVRGRCAQVTLADTPAPPYAEEGRPWFEADPHTWRDLAHFDAVLMR